MQDIKLNNETVNNIYKNAHIALQSISDLIPAVEDDDIKNELSEEYEGYEKIIGKISSFMAENNLEPKDINPLKKAMMWGSIKMKTLFNSSRNQVAEMMINGTVMGINELTAMKNEGTNLDEGVLELLNELLALEVKYEHLWMLRATPTLWF